MKKTNVKWIFNDHSTERFFERTALNVTKKDIVKAVTNNQIVPFKRINATRSMCYIHARKEMIKTIMHRKKNKIITILPWKSINKFKMEFPVKKYNNKIFRVNIFPDCYLETASRHSLTKIYEKIHTEGLELYDQMNYNHPLFDEIFDIAWCNFMIADDEHINITKERKAGNETFEIKGKAKEIEFILTCI